MKEDMLTKALTDTLSQIQEVLTMVHTLPEGIRSKIYVENEVGIHVRHVMDHFQAFLAGVESGEVDYNIRHRKSACETDPQIAGMQLDAIMAQLSNPRNLTSSLVIISEIDCFSTRSECVHSNVAREVLYLINHTIHHAAYIRLLMRSSGIALPEHIGIAPCTATFRREARNALETTH